MQVDEIRTMSDEDLLDELEDRKAKLHRLRFEKQVGQLEDTNLLKFEKRVIARIKTVLRERQLAQQLVAAQENEGN